MIKEIGELKKWFEDLLSQIKDKPSDALCELTLTEEQDAINLGVHVLTSEEVQELIKIDCEVYDRTVGYFRPTSNMNVAKKLEQKSRHRHSVKEINTILDK